MAQNLVVLAFTALVLLYPFCLAGQCTGDCDSLIQAASAMPGLELAIPDGDTVLSVDSSIRITSIGPSMRYEYESDSSHIVLRFSEIQLNRHQLYFSNWCNNQVINFDSYNEVPVENWTPAQLNARSLTKTFPVSYGDTLSFFKESWFFTLNTNGPAFKYYKNDHQLAYSVELVDSTTGLRIALLDTTYLAQTTSSRKPCMYSWYPMYSRVKYVVPFEGLQNTRVFIRFNTYATGSNPKPWVRTDGMVSNLSAKTLAHPEVKGYCDSVEANLDCTWSPSCDILARQSGGPTGITIESQWPTSITHVVVYTLNGDVVWQGAVPLSPNPYTVQAGYGLYIVIGYSNGDVVCTRKVVVY